MDCSDARARIELWLDGELTGTEAAAVGAHVAACPRCSSRRDELGTLSAALLTLPYHPAPSGLRERVVAASQPRLRPGREWVPLSIAAAALLAIGLAGGAALTSARRADPAAEQVVADHVRSLLVPEHLTDVASTDRHTVKPWFAGRLTFAPPVEDFASQGFPLIGGRIDYVGGQPVAAIVYGRRSHRISLFVWPSDTPSPARRSTLRGFHLLHWAARGMSFWLVSDVAAEDLDELSRNLM